MNWFNKIFFIKINIKSYLLKSTTAILKYKFSSIVIIVSKWVSN